MKSGDMMGWWSNGDEPLPVRVQEALDYYNKKYGPPPAQIVIMNPVMLEEKLPKDMNVVVRLQRIVLPNCFLIGVEDAETL